MSSNTGVCYVAGVGDWSYGGGGDDGIGSFSDDRGMSRVASYGSDVLLTSSSAASISSYSPLPPPPPTTPLRMGPSSSGSQALTMSREVPQTCPYCSKVISNFYNLKKHISTMHQSPAVFQPCTHCTATFRTPEYLRKHLVNVHKYPVKKKK